MLKGETAAEAGGGAEGSISPAEEGVALALILRSGLILARSRDRRYFIFSRKLFPGTLRAASGTELRGRGEESFGVELLIVVE